MARASTPTSMNSPRKRFRLTWLGIEIIAVSPAFPERQGYDCFDSDIVDGSPANQSHQYFIGASFRRVSNRPSGPARISAFSRSCPLRQHLSREPDAQARDISARSSLGRSSVLKFRVFVFWTNLRIQRKMRKE